MLKKTILASAILASTLGVAMADPAPYVGAGIGVLVNTPSKNSFGSYRGVPFNVLLGYGGLVNPNFYLAGELDGTVATAELSNSTGLRSTYSYGASILPGVMLSQHSMAFARVGIVKTRFSQANSNATGGQFGLGIQTCLMQNVDLRGEYDYTAYRTINRNTNSVSPRSDGFNVSLIYKLD